MLRFSNKGHSVSASPLGENPVGEVRHAQLTLLGRPRVVWCRDGKVFSGETDKVLGRYVADYPETTSGQAEKVIWLPIAICGLWVGETPNKRSWYALAL